LKILISNDDGINSLGIYALAKSLKEIGDVTVVAPITEQSAVGHAITMKTPLRVVEHFINGEFFGYAVEGTPADCVKMGIRNILKSPPDIVVSGINHGSNTAINIIYSGTVSAAREAAIMDVPAVAFSLTSHISRDFSYAAKVAQDIVKEVAKNSLPLGTCLNVNIPAVPESEINGVLLTKQSKSKWDDIYEERTDPYGKSYYWLTGSLVEVDDNLETDQFAIKNNYVAVTPIHFDLTDYKTYEEMKKWNIERKFVE
jgi:5'-nucleotidase